MPTNFKIPLLLLCFVSSIKIGNCQVRQVIEAMKPAKAFEGTPILKKKSQVLQVGIGAPNNIASCINAPTTTINTIGGILGGLGLTTATPSSTSTSNKIGSFYLDYEYLIKENLGLGIGFSYASATQVGTIPLLVPTTTTAKVSATSVLLSRCIIFM
jgi:hypothetical protein